MQNLVLSMFNFFCCFMIKTTCSKKSVQNQGGGLSPVIDIEFSELSCTNFLYILIFLSAYKFERVGS